MGKIPKLDEWLRLNPKNKCKERCFCEEIIRMKPIFEALSIASEYIGRELGLYIHQTPAERLVIFREAVIGKKASIKLPELPERPGFKKVGDFHTHLRAKPEPSIQDILRMLSKNYVGICIGSYLHDYKAEVKCYERGPKFDVYRKRAEELIKRIERANMEKDEVEMVRCIVERTLLEGDIEREWKEIVKECQWEK